MTNKDRLKPLSLLVIFFIVAFISVNILSQYYFSPKKINKYLQKSISNTMNMEVDFKKAQISFSGSLSPFFAIKVTGPHFKYDDCKAAYDFKAPYILIPLSLRDAAKDKLKLGFIKFGKAEITVRDSVLTCTEGGSPEKAATLDVFQPPAPKFGEFFERVERVFKSVSGIRAQQLVYKELRKNQEKVISFKRLRVSYHKVSRFIHSYFEIAIKPKKNNKLNLAYKRDIKLKVNAQLSHDAGLSIKANARFLEGVFELNSGPQKSLNNYAVKFKIKDLPLTFLSFLVDEKSLEAINSHRIWFNSSFKIYLLNFLSSKVNTINANIDSLEIFGPVLKSYASNIEAQLYPKFKVLKPMNWRLDSLNLNGLLSLRNLKSVRGAIDQFGIMRGSGQVLTDNSVSFEGLMSKSSFTFSMNRKKVQQVLTKANINFVFKYPNLNLEVKNIVLEKGVFDGILFGTVDWSRDFEWSLGANSSSFSLAPKVQELFAISQSPFEDLKFKMNGKVRVLENLSFQAELPKLKTKWGEFLKSNYNLSYDSDKKNYRFKLSSKQFLLNSNFVKLNFLKNHNSLDELSTLLILSSTDKSFDLQAETSANPKVKIEAQGSDYNKEFLANFNSEGKHYVLKGQINNGFILKK